ncbi:RsbRD N-terminal domain-containing protein [Thermodesulfobacteriota bacterium]
MRLNNLLAKQKTAVVKKWFALVIETYPPDTAKFLQNRKDPIANPVGRTIFKGLETLFDELLKDLDHEAIQLALDPVVRIRAVQNYSPSQAVGFLFFLKIVIRDIVRQDLQKEDLLDELLALESKIDELSLIAFNIYSQCKEKIYELRANEINRTFKAFERAGLVKAIPEVEPDPEPNINIT